MPIPSKREATYQDVLEAPDHVVAEILDGQLELSPRPSGKHGRPATRLTVALGGFDGDGEDSDGPGGWYFLFEPELHFGRQIVVPDVAAWQRTRLPDDIDGPFTQVAPDWACEVSSPSTASRDRIVKMRIYHEAGVHWVWIVDPDARSIEVFERDDTAWRRVAAVEGIDVVRLPPFGALALKLAGLWR